MLARASGSDESVKRPIRAKPAGTILLKRTGNQSIPVPGIRLTSEPIALRVRNTKPCVPVRVPSRLADHGYVSPFLISPPSYLHQISRERSPTPSTLLVVSSGLGHTGTREAQDRGLKDVCRESGCSRGGERAGLRPSAYPVEIDVVPQVIDSPHGHLSNLDSLRARRQRRPTCPGNASLLKRLLSIRLPATRPVISLIRLGRKPMLPKPQNQHAHRKQHDT